MFVLTSGWRQSASLSATLRDLKDTRRRSTDEAKVGHALRPGGIYLAYFTANSKGTTGMPWGSKRLTGGKPCQA